MADERIGLHSLKPPRGARRPRKRIGRGQGSGFGKTAGRGQKGAGARAGNKRKAGYEGGQIPLHMRMRKLRGPHMKKSMPFEPFRTHTQPVNLADLNRFEDNAEVTPEGLRDRGLATRKRIPVKVLGAGRARAQGPERHRARFQRCGPREDRGRGRHLHGRRVQPPRRELQGGGRVIATIASAFSVPDIRKKIFFTLADPGALPARRAHPRAGRRRRRGQVAERPVRRRQHPRLPQPLLRQRAAELRDLLARDHALHHGLDHPAAAHGRGSVAREAAEGRRGRPAEDHAVHALPDGRARSRPGDRLHVPLPDDRAPERCERLRQPDVRQALHGRRHAHRRLPRC